MKPKMQHINKRIVKTLAYFSSVKIDITVPLVQQDGKPVFVDWAKEVSPTLTEHCYFVEVQPYIIIKNISKNVDENLDWKQRSLYISTRTQTRFVKAFDDILKVLYDEKNDPFYLDEGRLKTHTLTDDQIVYVDSVGENNVFELRPTVDSEDNKDYEGASLSINSAANSVFLYLDEIDAIRNIIKSTNISMLALQLLSLYFAQAEKVAVGKVVYQTRDAKPKRRLFVEDEIPPDQESVADIGMATDDPFSNLEEKDEN